MGSVIKHWITTKLGLPVPDVFGIKLNLTDAQVLACYKHFNLKIDPVDFRKHLSNGYLIAEILRKYNIISDDQLISLGRSYSEQTRKKNMNYVHRWMVEASLSVNMDDLQEIIQATPGSAVKFLYNLYFILEATNLDCKVNKGLCIRLKRSLLSQPESSIFELASEDKSIADFQQLIEADSSSPDKCKIQKRLEQCVSGEAPIPVKFFPLKPDTTEASRLYFASEALKKARKDKLCFLETMCEAEERRRCPQVEPLPPPPPTSRKCKAKAVKPLAEQNKQSQMTSSVVSEMDKFDQMVTSRKTGPLETSHFQEMKERCHRPVEFGELEEERNFFQALFGKKTSNQKGIVTIGLEGGGQCWTTFDMEARKIAQQLLGLTFDLAMKIAEWREAAGTEPPEKLVNQWKAVIFHIPPLEMGRILRQSLGPIRKSCSAGEEDEEEATGQLLDEDDFIRRDFYNIHEEFTVEKILAEERKLILLQTEAEKELSVLSDMTSYEKAMGDYSEWLKNKEKSALLDRLNCFRRSGEGSEECSVEASMAELEQKDEETPEPLVKVAESSFAIRNFVRGILTWSVEVIMRTSDFKTETNSEVPPDRICWWKCGLWDSLMETGGFRAFEDREAAIHDEWLLQEDFVCGSFTGKIEDCNLKNVLEEERIIQKLKDQVELDYRLGKELDAYDEMVMDPDYLTVLAARVKVHREEQEKKCPLSGGPVGLSSPGRGKNLQAFRTRLRAIKDSRKADTSLHQKKERLRSSICARLISESPAQVYDDLMCTAMQRAMAICGKEKDLAEFMQSSHREKGLFYSHRVFEEEALQRLQMNQQNNSTLSQVRELDVCRSLAHRAATHSKHVQYEVRKAQWELVRAEDTAIAVGFLNGILDLAFRVAEYKARKRGKEPSRELVRMWMAVLELLEAGAVSLQEMHGANEDSDDAEEEEETEEPVETSGGLMTTAGTAEAIGGGEKSSAEPVSGSGGKGSGSGGKGSGSGGKVSVARSTGKGPKVGKTKGKGGKRAPPNSSN